jgi:CRISPR system Cascade subunit CasA
MRSDDGVGLNLVTDPWIPVQTADGPRVIRPDQIAEPGVRFPDWPRADLNLACLEFLVGLVFLAAPPANWRDWRARHDPDPDALRAAMAPLAPAFELLGDGPRFMQEAIATNEAPNPPDMLFIDSAGGSTAKKNADLMVRRLRYDRLTLPLAAMALYALQAFAPSGGAGNRTSMRGGGPMVTLVRPGDPGSSQLWSLVWANVPDGAALTDLAALPWMRPASPTSAAKEVHLPARDDTKPEPETFFGLPRRLRLRTETRDGETVVTGVHQRPWGANYIGWIHPLTPYYRTKTDRLPVHPKGGTFGYRNWRGVVLEGDERTRAAALTTYWDRTDLQPDGDMRLIVGGWAMNNMSPVDFLWSEQPLFPLTPEQEVRACGMVEAAEGAGFALAAAVRDGTGDDLAAGRPLRAREQFFSLTQTPFEAAVARMDDGAEAAWLAMLRQHVMKLFDAEVAPGLADLQPQRREAAVIARRVLLATLAGRTKAGATIFDALGMTPPPKRKRKVDA